MIILDSNSKTLEIASSVASLPYSISYLDVNKSMCAGRPCIDCKLNSETQGITTLGTVVALSAPTMSTALNAYSKEIEYINIYNSSAGSQNITVQINDGIAARSLFTFVLSSGDTLFYENGRGWYILNKNGGTPVPVTIDDMQYIIATGTDTYVSTVSGVPSYFEGLSFKVKFVNANTGPATLNVNGLGAIPIKDFKGDPLYGVPDPDIKAGQIHYLTYDGTNFQLTTVTCNIQNNV